MRWLFPIEYATSFAYAHTRRRFRGRTGHGSGESRAGVPGGCWAKFPSDVVYSNQANHQLNVDFSKAQPAASRKCVCSCPRTRAAPGTWYRPSLPRRVFSYSNAPRRRVLLVARGLGEPAGRAGTRQYPGGPPDQKMIIDTIKPIVRSLQARRQGRDRGELGSPGRSPRRWVVPSGSPAQDGLSAKWTAIRQTQDRPGRRAPGRQRPGDGRASHHARPGGQSSRSRWLKYRRTA